MAKRDFELIREREIGELNTRAFFYRHRTGAELLSLVNEDENKVFGINFRTPVADSTGVAHIMEHAVLCGSRKYPVKEPFVELIKGSLNTFLNAFTYPDRTCYPVASQNLQDFYNLIDVYLDAVFFPTLTPQVLQQEGWHYELEGLDEPLTYKGVVFNEMKGAYSDPESLLATHSQHSLFPDNTYGQDSGGDPLHIPELTFEQFEHFHEEYYHPANARIFFCGDDDPERRFELLEEYLSGFEPRQVDASIGVQPRFSEPKRVVLGYAAPPGGEESARSMVTVNWLLEGEVDEDERRALHILEHALIGTPGSPLRKLLIDSGLGEDLTGSGMEGELAQIFFGIGLKGVEPGKVEAAAEWIVEALEQVAREGIDAEMKEASLNTFEFRLRENNTGSYPRGLVLMLRVLGDWRYDRDPLSALAFEDVLARIRQRMVEDDWYLENLIRRHLLDNIHRTTVVLEPDVGLEARQEEEERARLEAAREGMNRADLEEVMATAAELRERQRMPDSPEALATLPRLQLSDLERKIKKVPIEVDEVEGTRLLHHDLFTNGIAYVEIGMDLRALPQELLPYVSLFGRALLEMGTEREDFVRLGQRIGARTGGMWTQSLISTVCGSGEAATWLLLRGKGMVDQVEELFAIAGEVLQTARFDDRERFLQMALEEKAGEESAVVPAGHRVISLRLRAQFDEASWISEQMKGLSYLFFLRQLIDEIENDWSAVRERLEEIRRRLVNRRAILVNATLDESDRAVFSPKLAAFLRELPTAEWQPTSWNPAYRAVDEGLTIPAQINYVGKGANVYDMGYELNGSSSVATRYLAATWLWERVRVQGGAYGAFCSFDPFSGVLSYASYRDPNLLETLEIYDQSGRFLKELEISEEELTKGIIGAVGDLDAYQLPDARGFSSMVRHLTGVTDEFRQQLRDQVLATRAEDFGKFGDLLEQVAENGRVVVLGSQEAIEEADAARGGWLEKVEVI